MENSRIEDRNYQGFLSGQELRPIINLYFISYSNGPGMGVSMTDLRNNVKLQEKVLSLKVLFSLSHSISLIIFDYSPVNNRNLMKHRIYLI